MLFRSVVALAEESWDGWDESIRRAVEETTRGSNFDKTTRVDCSKPSVLRTVSCVRAEKEIQK